METIAYVYEQKFRAWRKRLAGIYRYAKRRGWNVRVVEIGELKGDLGRMARFWKLRGAIVEGGVAGHRKIRPFANGRMPIVWCDFDENEVKGRCFGICHDSKETARLAIAELVKKRCREYGYVGFDVKRDWSKERAAVFTAEMAKLKQRASVFDPTSGRRYRDATEFYASLENWLSGLERPCGIFAANDEMGDHVLRAALNTGIALPDEMVVIGVDDDQQLCESTTPTLASVSPDFEKSGYLAADLLERRIENPKLKPVALKFGSGYVVPRESIRKFKYRDFAALKAVEFIRLHAREGIRVDDVVKTMGVSRRSAELRFEKFTGHSIQDEIEHVRFRLACELIRKPDVQLDTVYAEVGYGNERSLRHLFYKETGLSPSAWREKQGR